MAELVAAGIAWAAAAWGAVGVTAATGWVVVASYAIVVGAYYAYGTYQARSAREKARQSFNDSLKDRLVMTATTDGPRSRVYGRCRNVEGILYKATHGALKEQYTFVVAIAGHEIDAIEQVWFNDVPVTLDGAGWVQTEPFALTNKTTNGVTGIMDAEGNGSVGLPHMPLAGTVTATQMATSLGDVDPPVALTVVSVVGNVVTYSGGTNPALMVSVDYQYVSVTSKARVRGYLGAPGQDLSPDLIALGCPDITAAHKFQGIACLLVTLTFDQEAFAQGVPNFTATMRGAKILDTRTGLTAWSRNPAMIARDWACYPQGGGCLPSEIVLPMLHASANACDVTHTFTTDTGPQTVPTYVCDLVAPTLTDPSQTMNEIVTSMAGKYAWVGGLLRIKAGFYTSPAFTIDETWLSGTEAIEITAGVARNDLVNVYRPSIADKDKGYVVAPTEPVIAQAYVDADGQQLPRDVTLLAVTDIVHARHVCGVMLRDARQALTVKIPCNLKAYPVEPFDVGAITLARFGWDAKQFEVLSWAFSPTGGVLLTLKETAASIWDPDALFTSSDDAPNTGLPLPWRVEVPSGLVASSGTIPLSDGSIIARVLLTWNAATTEAVRQSGLFEIQYWPLGTPLPAGDDGWLATRVPGSATSTVISGLLADTPYIFRMRAINSIGIRSAWSVQIVHIVADLPPVSGIVDWTDIPGRPIYWRAVARGQYDTAGLVASGLYDENGAAVGVVGFTFNLDIFNRTTGDLLNTESYDIWTDPTQANALAVRLNGLGSDLVICLRTFGAFGVPQRLSGALPAAIYRCGGSPVIYASPNVVVHSAYVLVAIAGCGEGNGFETYAGNVPSPTNAFCDVSFQIHGGTFMVTGASSTPSSLTDYGYTGTLDATTDIVLIARGNCVVAGNLGEKIGGAASWDSDIYSRDSAYGACMSSAVPKQTDANLMFGLNSDPLSDQNYTSLDFSWYLEASGVATIWESGANSGMAPVPYVAGNVMLVLYDGSSVRYMQNGVVRRTVPAPSGQVLFFDSSFYTSGGKLANIRFGALSANDWYSVGGVGKPEDNATNGATIGVNLDGTITAPLAPTYIQPEAIGSALSSNATTGGRIATSDNIIVIYDAANQWRIKLGDLDAPLPP